MLVVLAVRFVHAAQDSWFHGVGRVYLRIVSTQQTQIVWIESIPNPDYPKEIWTAVVWSNAVASAQCSVSIAFEPTGTWSTENFDAPHLRHWTISTNPASTNALIWLNQAVSNNLPDTNTHGSAIISDDPTQYIRGQIMVTAVDGVSNDEVVALVNSYGHSIIEKSPLAPRYLIAIPLNEERIWSTRYGTNAIVRFAEPNGIAHLCSLKSLSNKRLQAIGAKAPQPEP